MFLFRTPRRQDAECVLTLPSSRFAGATSNYWQPHQVPCPVGVLVSSLCPAEVPSQIVEALHPMEAEHASLLDADRRREWIAGRLCLAEAVACLSGVRIPMLATPSGAPALPKGLVGSISHKGPFAVALVTTGSRGVGVDVECAERTDRGLARRVLTPEEEASVLDVDDSRIDLVVAAHFSAKEAVYKALRPSEQATTDFQHIDFGSALTASLKHGEWRDIVAQIPALSLEVEMALLMDGAWVIAAARRG